MESAIINSVSTMNLSDGCYKLDNVITRHVLRAANLVGSVERLNGLGACQKVMIFLLKSIQFNDNSD